MRYPLCILLFCFTIAGCAATDLPPVTADGYAQEDDERRIWRRSKEEQEVLNGSGHVYKDEGLEAYVNDVAERLQPRGVHERIDFRVKVLENPYLNAFAYPNGVLYIHTGMLARMDNEAQLATLLAHEMTHSTHRHAVRSFRDIKNKTAFLSTVQVAAIGLGPGVGDIVNLIGQVGTLAAITGYSKDMETEADVVGLGLMVKAGYDPEEAPKLFVHLKEELEEEDISEPFFFGTHPKLQNRIDNFEELLMTEYADVKDGAVRRDRFLEHTREVVLDNAVLNLRAGRFKPAERGVEKYLGMRSESAEAYFVMGEIYRQQNGDGDIEKAKKHYRKAVSLDPDYPDPHRGLGLIFYKNKEYGAAKTHFETYLSLYPEAPDRAYIREYIKQAGQGETE